MKKILILDANSLLNRAFYGIRPLSNSKGLPTNAIFGYINILKKHLDTVKPDFAAAAFDLHAPTFRHKFDSRYKATRKPMPDELCAQLPYLRRVTEALGIAVVEREGYEADDILGTLSRIAGEGGNHAYLVTGDRDAYQLVSDSTTLILVGTKHDEEVTPAVVQEKFGLSPRQMIDVKALAGDSGDNIPGVRGIGEKTALKLIAQCGNLDGVYADLDALPVGPSAKEKLRDGKEDAYKSRFLGEICLQVPHLTRVEDFAYEGFVPQLLLPLFVELEFTKMIQTFGLTEEKTNSDPLQGSLFDTQEEAPPIRDADAASVTETVFPLFCDDLNFYTLLCGEPVRLCGDVEILLRKSRPIVCDAKAYLHTFARHFGDFEGVEVDFDLFLAAYVLNSQYASATLSALGRSFCKDGAYLTADTDPAQALPLMEKLSAVLREQLEQSTCKELYYETELPLARVLAEMERVGFAVSREGIEEYGKNLRVITAALQEEIYALAGEEFLISSPKQLGKILFEKLGLPPGKKTKTGYATDAETLGKLRFHSPIIDLILNWRAASKLQSTYVEGMLKQIREDGRIHTVFNGMLTATGRLSSAEPNLQNIPVKTELGREMRRFFIAPSGCVLVDADYSQIELRVLAHMSGDENMQQFFLDGRDIHTKTASEIFHVAPEEVTPEMRKSAKAVNFGIVYGIGEYSLSQDLGVPMRVAKDYIGKYFALFPGIKLFLDSVKSQAHLDGYVTTLFGRRRYIPELQSTKKQLISFGERVAMNAPIQGTAADIIKIAMVRVSRRLKEEGLKSRLILQVHDELILECPESEAALAAQLLSEEMEGVVSYAVPLVAESSVGKTWFDAK